MTSSSAAPAAVTPRSVHAAARPMPALDVLLARRVLGEALLLGATADALLRDGITGLALPVWVALLAATLVSLTWRAGRRLSGEAAAWLLMALMLAATVAWRDSGTLQAAGLLAMAGALLMAAIATHQSGVALFAPRLRDLLFAASTRVRIAAAGLLPLAAREVTTPGDLAALGTRTRPAARAGLIAVLLLVVFGALLRGADPIFASLVELPDVNLGTMISHLAFMGVFTWLASGWARAALDRRAPEPTMEAVPFTLGSLEVTSALGALNALFALYVLTQLGWFFGGERFLHERTGLTAAEYARQGFFQVVWVALLVVPLLLATRAMLAPERGLARRHTMLSLPLIGLLGAIIVSAALRMRLYIQYYGLTTDRFYPMAFLAWLCIVLAWLACTVLRGRGERFVAGALGSGLVILLLLVAAAPDVLVARVNIARSARATDPTYRLDLEHLARLSGEAAPFAVAALLVPNPLPQGSSARAASDIGRCTAVEIIIGRWGQESFTASRYRRDGAWRRWNAGEARALAAVAAHARALRAVQHDACTPRRGMASPRALAPAR